jgi:primosomal protein N' (replication factor Y)
MHHSPGDIDVVGPAPCPIDRIRGRWRWHFLLKSDRPAALGSLIRHLAHHHAQPARGVRLEIDRDPEALL